ncbi:MAG TPA: sensor histidine kinase [Chthonomonadaceae bacterium]|nr:sensor histidine kinase [Chthonomonadaceae bacterium]
MQAHHRRQRAVLPAERESLAATGALHRSYQTLFAALEQALHRESEDLELLQEASQAFLGQDDMASILLDICRYAAKLSGASVVRFEPAGKACFGDQASPVVYDAEEGMAFHGERPIPQSLEERVRNSRSSLALTLQGHSRRLGTLSLFSQEPDSITADRQRLLDPFIAVASMALQKARLAARMRRSQARMRGLSYQLLEAQETERRHVARELHDEIGQDLTAMKIGLQAMERYLEGGKLETAIAESISIVDRLLKQVRTLSVGLRPPLLDQMGLAAALDWHLERHVRSPELRTRLSVQPRALRLSPEQETVCFRIAQEALTNVLRHAEARRVVVLLRQQNGDVLLVVHDNGKGFDVNAAQTAAIQGTSLGVLTMEERARLAGGHLEIRSEPGKGTTVCITIPVRKSKPAG